MNRAISKNYSIIGGILITAVVLGGAFCVLSLRTRQDLLDTWGFARQTRQEIAPGLYLYRTSGSDVMLGDVDGVGLIEGNIVKYSVKGTEVFFAVKMEKASQIRYYIFESNGKGMKSIEMNNIDDLKWKTP